MLINDIRIGLGSDLHRLGEGEGIILGGIHIPCEYRCMAHSDGDALLHACVDALLGACGKGDIGELFPDTREENRGRNSTEFMQAALDIISENGWQIINLDCNIHLQQPKLSPYKTAIRDRLAEMCGINSSLINIKAKTGEHVDAIGNSHAIRTEVIVLLGKQGA